MLSSLIKINLVLNKVYKIQNISNEVSCNYLLYLRHNITFMVWITLELTDKCSINKRKDILLQK